MMEWGINGANKWMSRASNAHGLHRVEVLTESREDVEGTGAHTCICMSATCCHLGSITTDSHSPATSPPQPSSIRPLLTPQVPCESAGST
jgi:hypothetical protein